MSDAIFTTRQSEPAKALEQFSGGPTSNRPSNAAKWLHYFDTDLGFTVVWDGSRWSTGATGLRGATGIQGDPGTPGQMAPLEPDPIPTLYSISALNGSSSSTSIALSPGTWRLAISLYINQNDGGGFEIQGNQTASIPGFVSVTAGAHLKRTGGHGFGRDVHGVGLCAGDFSVGSQVTTTLSISSIFWLGGTGSTTGCAVTCQKLT